jgi:hypothetical protein
VEIQLTKGFVTVIDDEDFFSVAQHKWCVKYCGVKKYQKPYAFTYLGGGRKNAKFIKLHNLLMSPPSGMIVDHIDGDPLNNRRSNLRLATQQQNCFNSRSITGASKYKGVARSHHGKWRAYISTDGKQSHLGYFDFEEHAAEAYNIAALDLFGTFARLNVIERRD